MPRLTTFKFYKIYGRPIYQSYYQTSFPGQRTDIPISLLPALPNKIYRRRSPKRKTDRNYGEIVPWLAVHLRTYIMHTSGLPLEKEGWFLVKMWKKCSTSFLCFFTISHLISRETGTTVRRQFCDFSAGNKISLVKYFSPFYLESGNLFALYEYRLWTNVIGDTRLLDQPCLSLVVNAYVHSEFWNSISEKN